MREERVRNKKKRGGAKEVWLLEYKDVRMRKVIEQFYMQWASIIMKFD